MIIDSDTPGYVKLFNSNISGRTFWITFSFGLTAFVILLAFYIDKVPPANWWDDGVILDHSRSLFTTWPLQITIYPNRGHFFTVLFATATYYITGFVLQFVTISFAGMRLLYFLYFIPGIIFSGMSVNRLFGRHIGYLVVLILLPAALIQNVIRPDVWVFSALSAALYFWILFDQTGKAKYCFIFGLALGLVMEGHFLAIRYIISVIIVFFLQYVSNSIKSKNIYIDKALFNLLLGISVVAVIFVCFRLIIYQGTLAEGIDAIKWQSEFESSLFETDSNFLLRTAKIGIAHIINFAYSFPLHAIGLFVGIVAGFWNTRQPFLRNVCIVYIMSFILFCILSPKPAFYYAVHELTIFAIVFLGQTLSKIEDHLQEVYTKQTDGLSLKTFFVGLSLFTVFSAQIIYTGNQFNVNRHLIDLGYTIREQLPENVKVVTAIQPYFFAVNDLTFYEIGFYQYMDNNSLVTEYHKPAPEVIIFTPYIDNRTLPYLAESLVEGSYVRQFCETIPHTSVQVEVYIIKNLANPNVNSGCVAPPALEALAGPPAPRRHLLILPHLPASPHV